MKKKVILVCNNNESLFNEFMKDLGCNGAFGPLRRRNPLWDRDILRMTGIVDFETEQAKMVVNRALCNNPMVLARFVLTEIDHFKESEDMFLFIDVANYSLIQFLKDQILFHGSGIPNIVSLYVGDDYTSTDEIKFNLLIKTNNTKEEIQDKISYLMSGNNYGRTLRR